MNIKDLETVFLQVCDNLRNSCPSSSENKGQILVLLGWYETKSQQIRLGKSYKTFL